MKSGSQPKEPRALVAMLALDTPAIPSPDEFLVTFRDLSGLAVGRDTVEMKDDTVVFTLQGNTVAIALIKAPIPWADLEGPCATAWWWSDATERMKHHRGHIVVFVRGPSDSLEQHLLVTQLVASLILHTDAAGVYWGSGTLVHEPDSFVERARSASRDDIPVDLWVDFRLEQSEDRSYRLFTTGMKAFDHMEIEIPRSVRQPPDILGFATAIAAYVIAGDVRIADGDTVGRSEAEKVQATHAPSMWDANATVLRLDF
ncbi:MAG: DUF4261 domain-containing protein [Verrucomicrobia bacterium]|nr:DUF4261 domain-containing protein [Verrucomicrobiota bacterium]